MRRCLVLRNAARCAIGTNATIRTRGSVAELRTMWKSKVVDLINEIESVRGEEKYSKLYLCKTVIATDVASA
jgi:hypothetical protein